ncbi:hypothetical protein A3H22_03530 [Candidatus Peribacteria bacterium RIFCSPLOWO2_12_FULL_55_15]|nr:MAG: hypothetical protein A2789_00945 [Candidatus Peribacteria bacterium RIFCSPHIGHO2_01_FULL_54_22]OGJ62200.1 MAG: hypothetical protein A3D12_00060 [Candidatus Peribacteria bacterium RIFCSPHIGHO2_02_FULL_55_24]OGJ64705.1 MAG: hypothetical protein A3E47_03630 [Candidatus Peribacteria bacterium RIFCSPHIGHO2_12_FULL_54_10]OGJ67776.1 MAG: hypothetical protein A2947_00150 [Candidatus Peribacteria bacterium RIFCSPLOWO2_01_FULL_54_110]OGJ69919.1 MAG: hypothetical protein A3H90_00845 [Candidatus Pe
MSEIPSSSNESPCPWWQRLPERVTACVRAAFHRIVHDPVGKLLTPELTEEILAAWDRELEEDRKHNPRRPYDMGEYERRIAVLNGIVDMHYSYLLTDQDCARQVRYRLMEAAGLIHYT